MNNYKTRYKHTKELNNDTPSTGSICCYDGEVQYRPGGRFCQDQFIEIADCHNKVRLHRAAYDSIEDWKIKIDVLIDELSTYRAHLENVSELIQEKIEKDWELI